LINPKYRFYALLDQQSLFKRNDKNIELVSDVNVQSCNSPPANHSPSGLYAMICHAVLFMGSWNLCVGSNSCSLTLDAVVAVPKVGVDLEEGVVVEEEDEFMLLLLDE